MPEITARRIDLGGHYIYAMEAGQGPLVLMCHGFPESWYSWRHQLTPLAEAGFHAVAMDMRGYGGSYNPREIEAFNQVVIASDIARTIEALGYSSAVIVGHDWGAPAVWHTALLYPEKVDAVIGMSVPYTGRGDRPPLGLLRESFKDKFFYILYFQEPGVAERELEADIRGFIRKFYYMACAQGNAASMLNKAKDEPLLQGFEDPAELPAWFRDQDLDFYTSEFKKNGFRGPLSWYRNLDATWEMTRRLAGKKIEQPVLFIAGEQDGVIRDRSSLERLEANLVDLRDILLLDNCGHWTQQESPLEVSKAMIEFLNQLNPGTGAR